MAVHSPTTSLFRALLGALLFAAMACGGGDEEGSQQLSVPGDAAASGADAALGADTGTGNAGGGMAGSGTAGGGSAGGGISGAGALDAGSSGGGGAMGGARDAGRDASPPADAGAPGDAGPPPGDGGDPFAEVRQVCVDTINMYRATLNLPPLARGSAMQEQCSDEGAKYDGDLNRGKPANQVVGHQSTRNRSAACQKVGFGAQDACPNWGVGARTGNATLADAIKRCLGQMWAEGMPPIPVADCIKDQSAGGCFLTHGHWINMSSASSKVVACGFYNVEGGTYWMNQDFASR